MSSTQPDGYLAMPASGKGRPVLVLHAWWGLNGTTQAFCSKLADAGFIAFAPDLYHGKVADNIAGAKSLSSALDIDVARADMTTATTFLIEQSGQDQLAVIGFSLGAFLALDLSISDPEHIRSVVVFYGTGPTDYQTAQADYLGHFAEADEFEPQSAVDELESALKQANRPVTFYQYPDTGHWFFEPDRTQAFNESASKLAWERTLTFLRRADA